MSKPPPPKYKAFKSPMAKAPTSDQYTEQFINGFVKEVMDDFQYNQLPVTVAIEVAWRVLMQTLAVSTHGDFDAAGDELQRTAAQTAIRLRQRLLSTGLAFGVTH